MNCCVLEVCAPLCSWLSCFCNAKNVVSNTLQCKVCCKKDKVRTIYLKLKEVNGKIVEAQVIDRLKDN